MKRAALAALRAACAACAAWGYDFTSFKPQGYVSDFSHVIDTASKL